MKSTLYVASSINGLMTRGESDSQWVSDRDEKIFADFCRRAGCILVGRKTFDQFLNVVYPVPGAHNIVLSLKPGPDNSLVHYAKNLNEALEKIHALGFDRFVTVGGSNVIGQVLNAGLIDEVLVSFHPYIFGKGLPTTGDFAGDLNLKFMEIVEQHQELLLLRYTVNPPISS